ncbi:hypothetical protein M747DRAFT_38762 [Aspergillus niger ATCC 13496]|uniref:Uncharacterized protein n=1 Tax=Aspergillus niger ATCC 13496 TaxID=1353008 RepID=A0A370BYJ1_ASPNG|nr:hypothetical protein M747DRAFT_38762 [Aspergillus niger ATCC 13496]
MTPTCCLAPVYLLMLNSICGWLYLLQWVDRTNHSSGQEQLPVRVGEFSMKYYLAS